MRLVSKETWLNALQWGDHCIVKGKTFFGFLQYLHNKARGNVDEKATHGAVSLGAGKISEADGTRVWPDNSVIRYFSNHHVIKVFRPVDPYTPEDVRCGNVELDTAKECAYSWGGIWELGKETICHWLGKKYEPKDRLGLYCVEHNADFALATNRYWTDTPSYQLSPSGLLDWFIDKALPLNKWTLVAYYDCGKFYLVDNVG